MKRKTSGSIPARVVETDYRESGDFSDVQLQCSDGAVLHYFRCALVRVPFFQTALSGEGQGELKSPVAIELPFAASTVNSFLNWIDMSRTPRARLRWLRSKSLQHVLDLGRLGNHYDAEGLLPACIGAIQLASDTSRADAENVLQFALEAKFSLAEILERSFRALDPAALPDWPRALWAALLEHKADSPRDRAIQMAVSIHADIPPSGALLWGVADDICFSEGGRLPGPSRPPGRIGWRAGQIPLADVYWTSLCSKPAGSSPVQCAWLLAFAQCFLYGGLSQPGTSTDLPRGAGAPRDQCLLQ